MNTEHYDQAFKFLAEQDPESLLLLLGAIEPGEQATIELLPREISVATVLPDQPYRIISARGERIVHVEAQTLWEPLVPTRMAEYGGLHLYKYRLPIDSYVIVLTPTGFPLHPPRKGILEAGGTRIETRYRIIRLWRYSARNALSAGRPALLPFVPLMKGARKELEEAATQLRDITDEPLRRETALHFALLGTLRYNLLEMLELIGRRGMIPLEQLKKHSSFYQYILEEGRQEGREEGREEGRRLAITQFFRHLVSKRFPDLQLGQEVDAVQDLNQLEELAGELDTIPDADTLRYKLAELSAPQ